MLENQLIEISQQPSVGILELKMVLSGLSKLGKGPLAHQIFLKSYGFRLQRSIEDFLALCPCYPETYSTTLSNLVFLMISLTTKESGLMFGDNPVYSNKIVQWAEWEIESLVRLVKETAPPSEKASLYVQLVRSRREVLDFVGSDESIPLSPRFASLLSTFAASDTMLVDCGGDNTNLDEQTTIQLAELSLDEPQLEAFVLDDNE
ncbi:unnamed protein product [Fraxinus pennsylvanica]|uniref:Uncharacterized protein n=1 Tax=Fraxinus pennsylvanica TaxID=56036 RepID=A0AAD2DGX4_9LAMI|nr:unnamed protein product [Fraxinus pennsylvanica]